MLYELLINLVVAIAFLVGGLYLGTYLRRHGVTQETIIAHAENEASILGTDLKDEFVRLNNVVKAAAAKKGITLP